MVKTIFRWVVVAVVVLFVALQLIPYGRAHTNPPVQREPPWDSPRTRKLAVRACFDCHSNQTEWPWYSNIAPVSWLVQRDVDVGRKKVNYSEWDRPQEEAGESAQTIEKGTMPPWYYPWARLSPEERQALIRGLTASIGANREDKAERYEDTERTKTRNGGRR